MGRASGNVANKMSSVNLRRKQVVSDTITVSQAAPLNLVIPLLIAPTNSRIAIHRIVFHNKIAISNHGSSGGYKIGTASAAGTLDDDSILTIAEATYNSAFQNTAIHKQNVFTTADMNSTLKGLKEPHLVGCPIVPKGHSVVATCVAQNSSGTGAYCIAVDYWEVDDENT